MASIKRSRPRFSLDLLRSFEVAARHKSFTKAAQELSLTQSAVSRGIKTLEDQLGHALFVRVHRGLRLTDAGQSFHRSIAEAFKLIDDATDHLVQDRSHEALTVTTSVPLASAWLGPRLPNFLRLHPGVQVHSLADDQGLDLERQRIDMALRWTPSGNRPVGSEHLFHMSMFPVCAPSLVQSARQPLVRASVLQHHVLLELDTQATRGRWSDWKPWLEGMNLQRLEPAGVLRFSHYDQIVQAAIAGSGIAMGRFPHSVASIRAGLLEAPFGRKARLDWGTYSIVIAPRSSTRPIVKAFVAWLHTEAKADAMSRSLLNAAG